MSSQITQKVSGKGGAYVTHLSFTEQSGYWCGAHNHYEPLTDD